MPYMNHTVLQPADRQYVAETHLFLVATFSQFMLIVNYLRLKVIPDFLHLQLPALSRLRISWICHRRWKIRATTYSKSTLIINHLQLKVDAVFSTLSMFSLNITPLRLKVADMGRTIQSTFVFRTAKHKTPRILR